MLGKATRPASRVSGATGVNLTVCSTVVTGFSLHYAKPQTDPLSMFARLLTNRIIYACYFAQRAERFDIYRSIGAGHKKIVLR
jgi:hypothetical protein